MKKTELQKCICMLHKMVESGLSPKDAINLSARQLIVSYQATRSLSKEEKSIMNHLGFKFNDTNIPSLEKVFNKEGKKGCCQENKFEENKQ